MAIKQHITSPGFLDSGKVDEHFSELLLGWYQAHKRDLPWRHTKDPYLIWLSEVILQQTRVVQGLPYFNRFVESFPTVFDLAKASEDEVLRLWQGLGYYSRARNMHHTAQIIVEEFNGVFPSTFQELLKLKGIGDYTAAAIASFAFNENVAVVDGNVFRVLARYLGIYDDISISKTKLVFREAAEKLMPTEYPGEFNQAIMEMGALQCTPVNPDCQSCVLISGCYAYENNEQQVLPVKTKKTKVTSRYINYLVWEKEGAIGMKKRSVEDIWGGLYDFQTLVTDSALNEDDLWDQLSVHRESGMRLLGSETKKHILSHQRLFITFWHIQINTVANKLIADTISFYHYEEIEVLPKPIVVADYLKKLKS